MEEIRINAGFERYVLRSRFARTPLHGESVSPAHLRSVLARGLRRDERRSIRAGLRAMLRARADDDDRALLDLAIRAALAPHPRLQLLRLPGQRLASGAAPEPPVAVLEPEEVAELTWIEIELVNRDERPLRDIDYEITLPDDSARRGRTDTRGRVRLVEIPSGACTARFDCSAELQDGVVLRTGAHHRVVAKQPRVILRLGIDPDDARFADSRFCLRSSGGEEFVRTVADDKQPGDDFLDLEFGPLDERESYCLVFALSADAEERTLIAETSYPRLHAMGVDHG